MMSGPLFRIMGLWGRQAGWLLAGLLVSLAALAAGVGLMAVSGFTVGAALVGGGLAVPAAAARFGQRPGGAALHRTAGHARRDVPGTGGHARVVLPPSGPDVGRRAGVPAGRAMCWLDWSAMSRRWMGCISASCCRWRRRCCCCRCWCC